MTESAARPDNYRSLAILSALLLVAFAYPLWHWVRFALSSELYSHILLAPFASVFFIWWKRSGQIRTGPRLPAVWPVAFFVTALSLLAAIQFAPHSLTENPLQNRLAAWLVALVLLFIGTCCLCLSRATLRAFAFPLAFLLFTAPFPHGLEESVESFLQHQSAAVAESFFHLLGTPVYRNETLFSLPNFKMQVARECSGIHSTLALFLTSLAAGYLLLRTWWSRTLLTLFVIPLALVRNGLRVTVIGELCVREGPQMIDHYIHRHGGPVFFALSLIPFGLLLLLLLKVENKGTPPQPPS